MSMKLSPKIIQEMCGIVSFKRGDSFYRAKKVKFEFFSSNQYVATVSGVENFRVTVDVDERDEIRASCSCPKLASIKTECQHIAAVLIAIYEQKRKETSSPFLSNHQQGVTGDQALAEGLLTLFNEEPVRSSGRKLHFENRQMLHTEFICSAVPTAHGKQLFGIEMKVADIQVKQIRPFLQLLKEGKPSHVSTSFTFDLSLHCFSQETDGVIQQLLHVLDDENLFPDLLKVEQDESIREQMLFIPPSSWERLLPFLQNAPLASLRYGGNRFEGIHLSEDPLPLQFSLSEAEDKGYQLIIRGLTHIVVLDSYRSVLCNGQISRLNKDDCKRLLNLKEMLTLSNKNQIPILPEQLDFFLEKVVPHLRKLGNVHISRTITEQYMKTPLVAKLYLDRLKNRLLAGLEFHYENIVIHPLESREPRTSALLIRDEVKEEAILKLMEESAFAKTDGGYFLQNEELEYEFLYHILPKLQKLVQVYATTAVRNRIFRENVHPQIRVKVKKERTHWLEFKFSIDGIPEQQIRNILLALEEQRKYYRLRDGALLSLETREFAEIQRFLRSVPEQKEDLESGLNVPIARGLRLLEYADERHAFTFEQSFRMLMDQLRNPGSLELAVPEAIAPILRDYQIIGYKWMKMLASFSFGGILADDMGLGKTVQSIAYILSTLPVMREEGRPALIVCPSSLTYNWLNEFIKFAPDIQAVVIDGDKAERTLLQRNVKEMDVVITSYPLLRRDIKWYEKIGFHTVFFDEAQAFKNPITQTARAVKRIQADHRFALTGTPIENSLEELWSIFHVVFPELLLGLKEYSHLSRETIAKRIRPFLLRRLKEDVLAELPEKFELIESVELLPEQKKLYAAYLAKLRHDTLKHLNKDTLRKNRIRILAGLTRLRQICCHPALFVDGYPGSSAKFEQLIRIIEESKQSGRRVLIFSQFTKMLALIGRKLANIGLPFFYLDGGTPSEERLELTNRFNEGERDLFLISLKAGGTGLNLTGADTVILYDLWWNPAVEEQAADRAHRLGQTKVVQVIKLIARGTIEEKMNELQEKKREMIDEIIESTGSELAWLTEKDIRELLLE
ncbi:DEAD/DEAH box helicase [Bacillus sp. Bva_UNVM-123]|uniref:DEAD/DEAH box helicase n=1 Tax=Bacillus sp. Bva_UNVM-123 TaxID=2829798 RepID=UPI00391EFC4E